MATTWLQKFNYATEYKDLKSLRELTEPDEALFESVKRKITDAFNAKQRDIVNSTEMKIHPTSRKNQYTQHDYFKAEDSMGGYLDEELYSATNHNGLNPKDLKIGDTVKFVAKNHLYSNQFAHVIEIRDSRLILIEIFTKAPPKHQIGNTQRTRGKAIVRTTAANLEKWDYVI